MSEFSLIEQYFTRLPTVPIVKGVGDDAAIVAAPSADQELVFAMDTMVLGRHFTDTADPADIGWKALAVNLSDMAAMGATPTWAQLALTLPDHDSEWLQGFAKGFWACADAYNVQLIGGDTTQGPLTITVQIAGQLPKGSAVSRAGAQAGDDIYVTGPLGDAAWALHDKDAPLAAQQRLNRPIPRVEQGLLLRPLANAMIDISDGLSADLNHILRQSGCGALLQADALPGHAPLEHKLQGGDDYELCVCLPNTVTPPEGLVKIGTIQAQPGLFLHHNGTTRVLEPSGYEHFT